MSVRLKATQKNNWSLLVCLGIVGFVVGRSSNTQQEKQVTSPPTEASYFSRHVSPLTLKSRHMVVNYDDINRDVYVRYGYSVSNTSTPCWLQLQRPVNCAKLFHNYKDSLDLKPIWPPPRKLSEQYQDVFLLHGYVKLESFYATSDTDMYNPAVTPITIWNASQIQDVIAKAQKQEQFYYYSDTLALYQALDAHPIKGQSGVVFGSQEPWVEGILLSRGSSHVTTVEYRKTKSEVPEITAITPAEWIEQWQANPLKKVDFAVAFSSLEHDGLGRYGDPLNPWGDVLAMERASCYVKPGGLFYLTVPTYAVDILAYNAHRIYGPVRWPLLAANWEVAGLYAGPNRPGRGVQTCQEHWMHWLAQPGNHNQPVVVLKNLNGL